MKIWKKLPGFALTAALASSLLAGCSKAAYIQPTYPAASAVRTLSTQAPTQTSIPIPTSQVTLIPAFPIASQIHSYTQTSEPATPTTIPPTHTPTPVPIDLNQKIPVLEYHNPSYSMGSLYMTPELFENQISLLEENGFQTPSLEELLGFINCDSGLPERSIIIRTDMGIGWPDYLDAFKILQEHGYNTILFILPGSVAEECGEGLVCWDELRYWVDSGVVIPGSHGFSHPDYATLTQEQALADAGGAQRQIEARLGVPVRFFSYPYDSDAYAPALLGRFEAVFARYEGYAQACSRTIGSDYSVYTHGDFDYQEFLNRLIAIGGEEIAPLRGLNDGE